DEPAAVLVEVGHVLGGRQLAVGDVEEVAAAGQPAEQPPGLAVRAVVGGVAARDPELDRHGAVPADRADVEQPAGGGGGGSCWGRWSLWWPWVTASRCRPRSVRSRSAPSWSPWKVTVVESLCSSSRSTWNSRTAWATTARVSEGMSASKSRSRHRPTRSSL